MCGRWKCGAQTPNERAAGAPKEGDAVLIVISVRFALLLKDDFSGATLTDGGQRFFVDGRPARPVRKPEGFFVFTGEERESWDVRIESARYFPRTVHIRAADLAPGMPLCTVRLYRRPHCGFADCGWLETFAPPGCLAAALADTDPPLTLKGLNGGLRLRGYTARNLTGCRVCVGEGDTAELFALTSRLPDGYGVDRPARHDHGEGEPVRLAFCAVADETGRCSIPVHPGTGPAQIRWYDEEAMQWREISCARAHS